MGFFRRAKQEERAQLPPFTITTGTGGLNLPTWAGVTVGPDQAMRLSALWSCVNLLASTVSTLPVDIYRRGEREPIEPLPLILQEPASGQVLSEWLYAVMQSLLLRGNAYGVVTARSGATLLPSQVELVSPDAVGVQVKEDGSILYRVNGKEISRDDVWHVRAFVQPGSVLGASPVEYARQAIGLGIATEQFGARYFGDGSAPSGVLSTPAQLGPEQLAQLDAKWKHLHSGTNRAAAVVSGDVKWQPIAIQPDESQFVESMRFNVAQIARLYNVPPEMVGGEAGNSLTYANVESQALHFLKFSVSPWLIRLETALNRLLPRNQYTKFVTGGLLKADTKTRFEAYNLALQGGYLTVDEIRELEDRPPLEQEDTAVSTSTNGQTAETVVVA